LKLSVPFSGALSACAVLMMQGKAMAALSSAAPSSV
jgi:hypothetical protein